MVSEKARQQVTVVLSGEGGDEAFMGYGYYAWAERLGTPLRRAVARKVAPLLEASGHPWLQRGAMVMAVPRDQAPAQHIFSQEQSQFSLAEIRSLWRGGPAILPASLNHLLPPTLARSLTPAEQMALLDFALYLPDDLLTKVDRASMAYGLEVRVPLLDHRLVHFALNLPPSLRNHPQQGMKYLLKTLLRKHLPAVLVDRPKWGFTSPIQHWLRGPLRELLLAELAPQRVQALGLLAPQAVQTYLDHFLLRGKDHLAYRLWNLVVLHRWASQYGW
jgi:asparagine synthase (glutamine-hydrolysing)